MKISEQEVDSALRRPLPKVVKLVTRKDFDYSVLRNNNPPTTTKEERPRQTTKHVYFGEGMTTRHREYLLDLLKTQRIAKNLCTSETEGLYLKCARSVDQIGSFQGRDHCEQELMNLVFCTFPGRTPHESS
jgi:hypothetical protein